jgi:succinyl-CoA synthetase alpha subunit
MPILIDKNTKVICQGLSGKNGTFYSEQVTAYRTKIIKSVKGGGR